jgi:ParB-like nuclease domain
VNSASALRLDQISVDDRLQPRIDGISQLHVETLAEVPESWPPVTVARVNDAFVLVDGFHRFEAAAQLGLESIAATVFEPDEGADLLGVAFDLNARHGRPLTLKDRKAFAARLLRSHPDFSDRQIGTRCGLDHETVGSLRRCDPSSIGTYQRKPGDLPDHVGLFDRIRFAKATRDQKALAGYMQRLAIALNDPYDEGSELDFWPDDPVEIARACFITMGAERATKVLSELEIDARFILQVTKARTQLSKENPK